jgi:hypothetical protein
MQQNALYYPHIGLHNSSLIKAMALFYDNIYRIVPDNVIPDDPEDLAALLEEGSIGRIIDPANYSKKASEEFLSTRWSAAALMHKEEGEEMIVKLHEKKIDERVRELFVEAGYKKDNHWMFVPTSVASQFMLFMANEIARKNKLSMITGDWSAWTGTSYFSVDGDVDELIMNIGNDRFADEYAESFGLFGLIMSELVPINISEITSDKILEFREKRRGEIVRFRECMHDLRNELIQIESPDIKIDTVEDKVKELIKAADQYKASADILKVRGWFGVSMTAFPAPMFFSKLFSIPLSEVLPIGASCLGIGGIVNILSTQEDVRRLRELNPASFIVDMRKTFKKYTTVRGGGDINYHAFNCMEEYVND